MHSGTSVLVAEDDSGVRWSLRNILQPQGMTVIEACDGEEALGVIDANERGEPDVVLLDYHLPKLTGEQVLRQARTIRSDLPIIMITGHGSIEHAVKMTKAGASDYLCKPLRRERVLQVVQEAIAKKSGGKTTEGVATSPRQMLKHLMGNSQSIQQLANEVERVAPTAYSVLLMGETGVGKEVVAKAIHSGSEMSGNELVALDCGAIPETLIESELFGYERGAFTGADKQHKGKFERAAGGSLMLDEIGNLSLDAQMKLLRVLQERKFYRVGGVKPIEARARVIAATCEKLRGSGFRRDLYFRLAEYVIEVPPLRSRPEDIPYLFDRFKTETEQELGKEVLEMSKAARDLVLAYNWPGNVRELKNVVRGAVLRADSVIEPKHIDMEDCSGQSDPSGALFDPAEIGQHSFKEIVKRCLSACEQGILIEALFQTGGNKAAAARLLDIDYKTIHTKARNYGICQKGPAS